MTGPFVIEPLAPSHVRTEFTCGVEALDRYFWRQAGGDFPFEDFGQAKRASRFYDQGHGANRHNPSFGIK